MNAFEKIRERLETELKCTRDKQTIECIKNNGFGTPLQSKYSGNIEMLLKAIEIVNQVEEEYKGGWIPCSEKPPKETGMYQVTVDDADEPIITAMYLQEVDIWCFHHGYDTGMTVLAWRPLPAPYKEE